MKKQMAVIAALVSANLMGCASVAKSDGVVLPFVAIGVVTFKASGPGEPRAARVNAHVAQLLDAREQHDELGADGQLVAAR